MLLLGNVTESEWPALGSGAPRADSDEQDDHAPSFPAHKEHSGDTCRGLPPPSTVIRNQQNKHDLYLANVPFQDVTPCCTEKEEPGLVTAFVT